MNKFKNELLRYGLKTSKYLVFGACIWTSFDEYIGDFVFCKGSSMEPTIYPKNVLFMKKVSAYDNIKTGDIVITKSPFNPKENICKRVIGLPGDIVKTKFFSEIVPKGYVWIEGDNRLCSSDSRDFGPIPLGLIKGRVICRVWPPHNIMLTA